MAVYNKILELIKKEIETDPEKRGYAGKTDAEIAELLNSSFDVPVTSHISRPAPLNRILSGLTGAGNRVGTVEVTNAKKATVIAEE